MLGRFSGGMGRGRQERLVEGRWILLSWPVSFALLRMSCWPQSYVLDPLNGGTPLISPVLSDFIPGVRVDVKRFQGYFFDSVFEAFLLAYMGTLSLL